jgi:hypothetical protein
VSNYSSQEAIARYYHEKRPNPDCFLRARPQARTKTEMLLNPEFWEGQQLGDANSEVHARSMRPLCEVISINPVSVETMPKNLVLFVGAASFLLLLQRLIYTCRCRTSTGRRTLAE